MNVPFPADNTPRLTAKPFRHQLLPVLIIATIITLFVALPNDLPPETLQPLLTINGGEQVSVDQFPSP